MLTWSSWLAEVGRLSIATGWARCWFSLASAAAQICASMKPELRPGSGDRKAGRPLSAGSVSSAIRRSASEPISASATAI